MSTTKKLCFSALMLDLGILLPMLFHMIPNAGAIFAPMHLPVFLAGFLCGPFYGALVGLTCPLFSSLFTGMPALPMLPNMMVELLVYSASSGVLFRLIKTRHFMLDVYLSLICSMLLGRAAGGTVAYLLFLGGNKDAYSWAAFFTTYFVVCWPAIIIQLALVPSVVGVAKKVRFIGEADRSLDPAHREKSVKKQRLFFNSLAENWRRDAALSSEQVGELLRELPLKEGDCVLDVGCGTGVLDGYLLGQGCVVDGIDLSDRMIERARKDPANAGANYSVGDFYEYPVGARYDALVVFDAYPHFTDKPRFVKKAYELLKENGVLFILFDESKEKINGYHSERDGCISQELLPAKKEARIFLSRFEVLLLRDDSERYTMGFRKKFNKK